MTEYLGANRLLVAGSADEIAFLDETFAAHAAEERVHEPDVAATLTPGQAELLAAWGVDEVVAFDLYGGVRL
jgi:hypothetical protein